MTPRLPPKNASEFNPGGIIRLEFPAQGYVNPSNTTLEFDVQLLYSCNTTADYSQICFQNNIQSIFSRVRLLYGSSPLEDIIGYNVIVRQLTEWTSTGQQDCLDQVSINEGIGGTCTGVSGASNLLGALNTVDSIKTVHTRRTLIHGYDLAQQGVGLGCGVGVVPNGPDAVAITSATNVFGQNPIKRYQVQLALGIFNQEKLIPTKFMASQLAIELTLAPAAECIYWQAGATGTTDPTYLVKNVNLIPEILEFDASYDESFIKGLMEGGVPIKFSTWNNYRYGVGGSSTINLQIQERSRSVKAIFAMQRRDPPLITRDSGACFFNSATGAYTAGTTLNEYQFRIGGR